MIIRSFVFLFEVLMCVSSPTMLYAGQNVGIQPWVEEFQHATWFDHRLSVSRGLEAPSHRETREYFVLELRSEPLFGCFGDFQIFSHFHFTLTSKKISIILHYLSASPTYFLICFGSHFYTLLSFFSITCCLKKNTMKTLFIMRNNYVFWISYHFNFLFFCSVWVSFPLDRGFW